MEFDDLTDECPMPLGKHTGTPMQEVPAEYLVWYRQEAKRADKRVIDYIIDNWDVIQKELKR